MSDERKKDQARGAGKPTSEGEQDQVAIALDYQPQADTAPRVVAKGQGELARRIVEIARENGIAVERDADLAALLSAVELDQEIPAEAFAAVAEILGYLYRANGRLGELTGGAKAKDDRDET